MMLPRVNLNGTTGKALLELNLAVVQRLRDAITALLEACPHGRDYQTMAPGAHREALEDHRARVASLQDVLAEVEEIVDHLVDFA